MRRITQRFSPSLVFGFVLATALSGVAGAEEPFYVGSSNCKKCHIKQWKSWSLTSMANAYDLLKPGVATDAKTVSGIDPEADYTTDPECVPCHVTGWGKPGGFVDMETTPELAGVGCESCHGPGGIYIQDGYMTLANKNYAKQDLVAVGLVDQVSTEQCTTCHNDESPFVAEGYVFDFTRMKDEGTHDHFELKYDH